MGKQSKSGSPKKRSMSRSSGNAGRGGGVPTGTERALQRALATARRTQHGIGNTWVKRGNLYADRKGHRVEITDTELHVTSRLDCECTADAEALLARIKERLAPSEPEYTGDMADFARDCAEYVSNMRGIAYNDMTDDQLAAELAKRPDEPGLGVQCEGVAEVEYDTSASIRCELEAVCTACKCCPEHCVLSDCKGDA